MWTREEVIAMTTQGALATWTRDIMGGAWQDEDPLDRWCLTVQPTQHGDWRYTIRAAKVFGPPRQGFARSRIAAIQAARVDWVELMVEAITNLIFPNT
tara:strand:+ start:210 stop:503 length:294 start_codon:yes stop_codon:yes gene_type:complete